MHLHTDTWHPCVQQAHDHTDVQVELAIMQYYDAVVVVEMGGGSFIVQKADNAKVFFFFVFVLWMEGEDVQWRSHLPSTFLSS